jgi:hypothetical protein
MAGHGIRALASILKHRNLLPMMLPKMLYMLTIRMEKEALELRFLDDLSLGRGGDGADRIREQVASVNSSVDFAVLEVILGTYQSVIAERYR